MKKSFREKPTRCIAALLHEIRPTPLAIALICLFPAAVQAAQNMPLLRVDPDLLLPPAPRPLDVTRPKAEPTPKNGAAAPDTKGETAHPQATAFPLETHSAPAAPPVQQRQGDEKPEKKTIAATSGHDEAKPVPQQGAEASSLSLKPSRNITVTPPPGTQSTPIFISAMLIQGHQDAETEAIDEAELRQWGQVITADRLRYDKPEDELHALGNVRIDQKGDITEGPELKLQMEKKEGFMQQPVFQMNQQIPPGRGDAKMLLFEGENKYRLEDARYTTCQAGSDDWFIHANNLEIDRTAQVGTARNAYIEFMDVPFLYTPWMNFTLNSDRKSGFLTPTYGSTGNSGAEFSLPYYWNIAPNRDATITPRLITKRGIQIKSEFRYLDPTYSGIANLEVLPNDRVAGINRDFMSLHHRQYLGRGWNGSLDLERVSDDNYFRDLSTQTSVTSQTNLLRDALLSYSASGWMFSARSQSFQTLQDPLAPIVAPYRRNQLVLNGAEQVKLSSNSLQKTNLALNSEIVDFTHPNLLSGKRFTLYPSVSLPLTRLYGYVTPKIGLHSTRYSFDDDNNTTAQPNVSRSLPIFSVDSGLYFDRKMKIFDQDYQQTLEPRLYYLRVPYRDQSNIPVFDTGDIGFGIPQIFSENRFSGNDRISDANQITLGVTSRFLDPGGRERLRGTVAQRYYLSLPKVTLPGGVPPDRKYSDMLASVGGQITKALALDSFLQYDPELKQTSNFTITSRYLPAPGKALSASYRYIPTTLTTPVGLKLIDTSAQWPLIGGWTGLARWNYSILDKKLLDSLAGLEYNTGCWSFRAVLQSLPTTTSERVNSIFFQLELNGISSIGSNPLDVLKHNIFGYTKITNIPYENNLPETR